MHLVLHEGILYKNINVSIILSINNHKGGVVELLNKMKKLVLHSFPCSFFSWFLLLLLAPNG
jgi:hypothetical protein